MTQNSKITKTIVFLKCKILNLDNGGADDRGKTRPKMIASYKVAHFAAKTTVTKMCFMNNDIDCRSDNLLVYV